MENGLLDAVVKLAGFGAVGVACLALYFWHAAFGQVTSIAAHPDSSHAITVLTEQLSGYHRMVLGALLVSALVQIIVYVGDKAFPPPPAVSAHKVALMLRNLDTV